MSDSKLPVKASPPNSGALEALKMAREFSNELNHSLRSDAHVTKMIGIIRASKIPDPESAIRHIADWSKDQEQVKRLTISGVFRTTKVESKTAKCSDLTGFGKPHEGKLPPPDDSWHHPLVWNDEIGQWSKEMCWGYRIDHHQKKTCECYCSSPKCWYKFCGEHEKVSPFSVLYKEPVASAAATAAAPAT